MSPLIELHDVALSYPGAVPVHALKASTLEIDRGERVAVVGPSGSGKTTLLQVLGVLAQPTAGTYRLDGFDVSDITEDRRCDIRGSMIGFVFQSFHLMAQRSVRDNVELPLRYSPEALDSAQRASRVDLALESVAMAHRADHLCNQLSGGESQRVAIARAMVTRPSLILADEPTGNLDSANTETVIEQLMSATETGATLVVITHEPEVAARFERRLIIHDGTITDSRSMP